MDDGSGERAFVKPSGALEEAVARVWKDVLCLPEGFSLSAETDFVHVGGNSLLAGKATSLIRSVTGVQIPSVAMYQVNESFTFHISHFTFHIHLSVSSFHLRC